MHEDISFIGGGNMATSLIGGLIANGLAPRCIAAADPAAEQRGKLETRFGIRTFADNAQALGRAQTIVLAVKPQTLRGVAQALAPAVAEHRPLIISIVAGVREPDLRRWLGFDAAIVRSMPNTPALVRSGATALYANPFVAAAQRERAESVLGAVGITLWVDDESLLDAVTALSGSGPAYCFLLIELMARAGEALGLGAREAGLLARQTVYGAARMAMESEDTPATQRRRVTSPGGTTERALDILAQGGMERLLMDAIEGARDRAVELGESIGKE